MGVSIDGGAVVCGNEEWQGNMSIRENRFNGAIDVTGKPDLIVHDQ